MRVFKTVAAQGDVYIRRIDKLPEGVVEVAPKDGRHILSSSETGHLHVVDSKKTTMYQLPDSIMDCLLVVHDPVALEHLRNYDTHEPILFDPGVYHIKRQREYVAGAWRKVQD